MVLSEYFYGPKWILFDRLWQIRVHCGVMWEKVGTFQTQIILAINHPFCGNRA